MTYYIYIYIYVVYNLRYTIHLVFFVSKGFLGFFFIKDILYVYNIIYTIYVYIILIFLLVFSSDFILFLFYFNNLHANEACNSSRAIILVNRNSTGIFYERTTFSMTIFKRIVYFLLKNIFLKKFSFNLFCQK